jgi:hypothetical protein
MSDPLPPGTPGSPATSPLVESILQGSAPAPLKAAAARGALPLSRPELLRVLVTLVRDAAEEIREAALTSLADWPIGEVRTFAPDPATPPEILAWFLAWARLDAGILASLSANPSTPVEALIETAGRVKGEMIDILLLSQTRIIQSPRILDAIEASPHLSPLQRNRIEEIRRHLLQAPAPKARPGGVPADPGEGTPETGDTSREAGAPEPQPVSTPSAEQEDEDGAGEPPSTEGLEELDLPEGAYERILAMNVTQKIALAARGGREDRLILIRDSSRSVQVAVIGSPKMTESEVEAIAKMRSVRDEILRKISTRRDWMKNIQIVRALASNPKTPLPISLTLLKRLSLQDLKTMISDRNLPDTLRRMAKRNLDQKLSHR